MSEREKKLTQEDWQEACLHSGTTKSWSADMIRNLNIILERKAQESEQPRFTQENLDKVSAQTWNTRQACEFMRELVGLPRNGTPPYWHICEAVKVALYAMENPSRS